MTTYSHINSPKKSSSISNIGSTGGGGPPDDWRMRMEIAVEGLSQKHEISADKIDILIAEVREQGKNFATVQGIAIRLDADAQHRDRQVLEIKSDLRDIKKELKGSADKSGAYDISRAQKKIEEKQKELDEKKETIKHYTRYAIATCIGVFGTGIAGLITYLIQSAGH